MVRVEPQVGLHCLEEGAGGGQAGIRLAELLAGQELLVIRARPGQPKAHQQGGARLVDLGEAAADQVGGHDGDGDGKSTGSHQRWRSARTAVCTSICRCAMARDGLYGFVRVASFAPVL